jgi:predicted ABC-type sugar transport system permease subunit
VSIFFVELGSCLVYGLRFSISRLLAVSHLFVNHLLRRFVFNFSGDIPLSVLFVESTLCQILGFCSEPAVLQSLAPADSFLILSGGVSSSSGKIVGLVHLSS